MVAGIAAISVFYSCDKDKVDVPETVVYPAIATDKHPKVLTTTPNGIVLNNGGYGSSMVQDPTDKSILPAYR